MGKLVPIVIVIVGIAIAWFWFVLLGSASIPELPEDPYYGPEAKRGAKEDISVRPFKIAITDNILTDLKQRLAFETSASGSRLIQPLEGVSLEYGINTVQLYGVLKYWSEHYNWKARETLLNKYPHFKTKIAGLDIHFQHVKSASNGKYKSTQPLLLLHGWPGSFVEFQKLIPLLIDPVDSEINFELVIPSLPGFGFSEAPSKPGVGSFEMAHIFHKLMTRLGHEKYYIQGGDWGSQITTIMGAVFCESVKGIHLNMCMSTHPRSLFKYFLASVSPTWFMDPEEAQVGYPITPILERVVEESGYFHIQATKPDTLGAALSNSPSGLAAWILEKFQACLKTNSRYLSDVDNSFVAGGLDELLDNLMVYWVTNSITAPMRLYAEAMSNRHRGLEVDRFAVQVPSACLQAPREVLLAHPRWALESKYQDLRRYSIAAKGGHFLALEEPVILANDVISFVTELESEGQAEAEVKHDEN